MGSKPSAEILVHLHKNLKVTPEKVTAFGSETYETQLSVLAELRARSGDDTTSIEYAVAGLALGFTALVIAPSKGVSLDGLPWWVLATIGIVYALAFAVVFGPFLVPQMLRRGRKEQANVWLLAFEDEIARRRSMGGSAGRAWRRTH